MPIVEVNMREQSYEIRKKIAEGITKVISDTGVPEHAITVVFKTVNPDHIALGGEMLIEKLTRQEKQE